MPSTVSAIELTRWAPMCPSAHRYCPRDNSVTDSAEKVENVVSAPSTAPSATATRPGRRHAALGDVCARRSPAVRGALQRAAGPLGAADGGAPRAVRPLRGGDGFACCWTSGLGPRSRPRRSATNARRVRRAETARGRRRSQRPRARLASARGASGAAHAGDPERPRQPRGSLPALGGHAEGDLVLRHGRTPPGDVAPGHRVQHLVSPAVVLLRLEEDDRER